MLEDPITMQPEAMHEISNERRTRDREQRRTEIMRVALELFARKGYEGTTMAEIATATQLAVGTLYKFFKDKHDLYQALVVDTVHDFERQMIDALNSPGDELQKLHRFIDVGSDLFVRHLAMARVYFGHTAAAFLFAPAGLEDEAFVSHRRITAAAEAVFREGIRKGRFVDMEPAALVQGLQGIHNGFLASLIRTPNATLTVQQISDFTKRIFFNAIVK